MEKLDYRPSLKNVTRHWVKCIFSDETENHKYDYSYFFIIWTNQLSPQESG